MIVFSKIVLHISFAATVHVLLTFWLCFSCDTFFNRFGYLDLKNGAKVPLIYIVSWLGGGYGIYPAQGRRSRSDSPRAIMMRPETEGWINLYYIISQSISIPIYT